jgi:hypothetical protein
MGQCVTLAADPAQAAGIVAVSLDACCDLLELFGGGSDGRSDQGRDHPVAAVLALAAAATVAGMTGYTAIAGWVADVPAAVLAEVYMRAVAAPARPPSKSTIWRVLTDADTEAFDAAIGTWPMNNLLGCAAAADNHDDGQTSGGARAQVRLDGKTVRGATDTGGRQLHLLAALAGSAGPTGDAVVVAQAEVDGAKPRESVVARRILAKIDLTGKVVTADALHTVKATAELICSRGGQFVLPVQGEPARAV